VLSIIISGCSLSTDQVNITKQESGESLTQVDLAINHADLTIIESADSNVHAQLTGSKASQDDAMLDMTVTDSILKVKAALIEGSYIDLNKETLNDQTRIKLTLSLPKKQYEKMQVHQQDPASKLKIWDQNKNEKRIPNKVTKVDSLFGEIKIKR